VTLDGNERQLDADITCIVDGNAAKGQGATIALAGVMGGLDSEVTQQTRNILLESATFSGAHTSRTSRKLQLFSEASARYERGVDAATCEEFSLRAAQLLAAVSGGAVCPGVVDAWPGQAEQPVLEFNVQRCWDLLGAQIAVADIRRILTALGCTVEPAAELLLLVTPPTYRPDLTREVDLFEEVLRVWGMDKVVSTLPGGRGRIATQTPAQRWQRVLDATLRACGLNETMTYAFAAPSDCELLGMQFEQHQQAVQLINPMNSDQSQMRRTILPGLLRSVAYNQSRGVSNIQLYETGTVFFASPGRKLPKERQQLAFVLAGSFMEASWNLAARPLDFFAGKGVLTNILRELNIVKYQLRELDAQAAPWLQPGRAAQLLLGSRQIGWLGEVHPSVLARFEAQAPVVACELDLAALLDCAQPARPYVDVPQFPAVELDLALVVDEAVTAQKLSQVLSSAGGNLLTGLRLFDVFRDEQKLGAGKKSLAFKLTYCSPERTLTLDEVEKLHSKVMSKAAAATGATVRA